MLDNIINIYGYKIKILINYEKQCMCSESQSIKNLDNIH